MLVHVRVRSRPHAEFLAVVDDGEHGDGAAAAGQIVETRLDVGKRDQVAQPLTDREDAQPLALIFGQVIPADGLGIEPAEREVPIIDEDVLHADGAERPRKVRLPHALGQPHPARAHAEVRADEFAEPRDLAPLVAVGEDRQDRLVEAARQELHLAARDDGGEPVERRRGSLAQPFEQVAGEVSGQPDLGARDQPIEQRRIGALGRFGDDVVEISDGLVVVDAEAQREDVVAHERTTPAARLLAIEIPVDHGGRESLGFHEAAQLLDEGD